MAVLTTLATADTLQATTTPQAVSCPASLPASEKAMRVMHVDLDYIYDSDLQQMQKNVQALTDRVIAMQVNTVFLQAYADPLGDGLVRSLYFPNRWLPMRADLFAQTAQTLRQQANVAVYAWMPVLSFDLDPSLQRVTQWDPANPEKLAKPAEERYLRLSPFDPEARRQIAEIYQDLAKHAEFDGILFHDDAILSDFEDASAAALTAYGTHGLPTSIAQLRDDPMRMHQWTRLKTTTLNTFTLELRDTVNAARNKPIKTARNMFALPIMNPQSEAWFGQNLDDFLALYDWTAPMAMPLMEGVAPELAVPWLRDLVDAVAQRPNALARTVFELQARDWSKPGQPAIEGNTLAAWMQTLQQNGADNFGYYPDDVYKNAPDLQLIQPILCVDASAQNH